MVEALAIGLPLVCLFLGFWLGKRMIRGGHGALMVGLIVLSVLVLAVLGWMYLQDQAQTDVWARNIDVSARFFLGLMTLVPLQMGLLAGGAVVMLGKRTGAQ